jgi:hypothetical protein
VVEKPIALILQASIAIELEFYNLFNGAVRLSQWPGLDLHEFFKTNLETVVGTILINVPAPNSVEPKGTLMTRSGDNMNQEDNVNDSTLELRQLPLNYVSGISDWRRSCCPYKQQ